MHFVENQLSHFPLSVRGGENWLKIKNVLSKVSRFIFQACLQNLANFMRKENIILFFLFMFKNVISIQNNQYFSGVFVYQL